MGEPSEKDGSFSVPAEQPTRHFTDAEVRRNYEYILTSTNLYPPELHSAVRSVLSEPPLNPDWSDKGRQIAALFTPYGDREYQGDLLYRTRLHGEDGISFFFDEGYTYIPWNGLAFLLDAMIEDGDYEYLVNKMAAIRWRGSDLDASYHAALFLMASHPALFQKMDRYLCPEGIDFTKMMRKEEFEYDWMKITADAARNLFSWNSKCAATPFEISRMPAPAIRALFTACFIANGDYMVSVRKNDKGEKVFEIDDSAGKRREAFNLQMEQMMEAPGMEPD